MSIFKERRTSADRSASDRRRHRQKIENAIKEGIHHIVSNESIIGQDGKKKFKIPVKGIKEYQFIFGKNEKNRNVGSAHDQDVKKGQIIDSENESSQKNKAGDDVGEEMYEIEISLNELASYLFDDLHLPDLEKKKMKIIMSGKPKKSGFRKKGPNFRLSKIQSLKNRKRRKASAHVDPQNKEIRFPFHEDDLVYHHVKIKPKESTCAVVFFALDVSGSMSSNKKFLARSFFFLLYHFLRYKYDEIHVVFVSHTTEAREVDENKFFSLTTSGGTFISSAFTKISEIIHERYNSDVWNLYVFYVGDGDNWEKDNEKLIKQIESLKKICQLICYCEVYDKVDFLESLRAGNNSVVFQKMTPLIGKNMKKFQLFESDDVWPTFKKIFGDSLDDTK